MPRAERWKPVPGWPLLASDRGRIKRVGKQHVKLKRKPKAYLILLAFKGPPPAKWGGKTTRIVARHLDDDRSNNYLSNLAWGTRSDNARDAMRNGRLNTPEHRQQTSTRMKNTASAMVKKAWADGKYHSRQRTAAMKHAWKRGKYSQVDYSKAAKKGWRTRRVRVWS